jgi:beta-lactamase regulating signal transducer with metallopeptidase domain
MEQLFIYLIKSSGLIAVFYLAYHFLVRKETFFTSNRWFLIAGLFTSLLLPLFIIKKIIYVERPKVNVADLVAYTPTSSNIPAVETFDWMQLIWVSYILIAALLVIKIIFNFISLYRMLYQQQKIKNEQFILVDLNHEIAPFSFFNYIVYNSNLYSQEELQSILLHEKIHSQEFHSFDVMLAKLFSIVFWFNPFVWLYKKAIIQNLEYIADQKAVAQLQDPKVYQRALLKVVTNQNCLAITNNFYQSLIKKRIVMLNKNQSRQRNSWKYAVILPFLIAFILLFQIETVAQTKENKVPKVTYSVSSSFSSILTKNTTNQEIKELEKTFSGEKQKLKISNVKRNSNNEIIAIKLEFDYGKTYNRVMERKSEKPINNIKIYINSDKEDDLAYGFEDVDTTSIDVILIKENKPNESKITTIESLKGDAVIYVDGERYDKETLNELDPKEFAKIEILNDQKSLEKYDAKDKKEVIIITTNKSVKNKKKTQESDSYKVTSVSYATSGPEDNISRLKEHKNVDYKKAIIFFDGKEIPWKQLDEIDPNIIASTSVIPASKYALDKYGEKAADGVIEIESKNYFETNNPFAKIKAESEKIKSNKNLEIKKELELKAQENSKLTKSEMEERMKVLNKKIELRNKMLEERKKKMEERKKELQSQ